MAAISGLSTRLGTRRIASRRMVSPLSSARLTAMAIIIIVASLDPSDGRQDIGLGVGRDKQVQAVVEPSADLSDLEPIADEMALDLEKPERLGLLRAGIAGHVRSSIHATIVDQTAPSSRSSAATRFALVAL